MVNKYYNHADSDFLLLGPGPKAALLAGEEARVESRAVHTAKGWRTEASPCGERRRKIQKEQEGFATKKGKN